MGFTLELPQELIRVEVYLRVTAGVSQSWGLPQSYCRSQSELEFTLELLQASVSVGVYLRVTTGVSQSWGLP